MLACTLLTRIRCYTDNFFLADASQTSSPEQGLWWCVRWGRCLKPSQLVCSKEGLDLKFSLGFKDPSFLNAFHVSEGCFPARCLCSWLFPPKRSTLLLFLLNCILFPDSHTDHSEIFLCTLLCSGSSQIFDIHKGNSIAVVNGYLQRIGAIGCFAGLHLR